MKTIPRKITPKLVEALKVSPIVFLNGARQSGKSTLVQSIASGIGNSEIPSEVTGYKKGFG